LKILDVPQSGSVAATTSSRNRFGQYRRTRAIPVQPRTASQVAQRARLTTVSAGWRGLTDAQRASWVSFANSFTVVNSIGATITLTGSMVFVKVNTVNLLNGDASVVVPPALPSFIANTTTGFTVAAGTPAFAVAGVTPAAGTKYMWYASPQLSAGVSFNGVYRYISTASTFTSGSLSLLTPYTAKWGTLVAGKKIFLKSVQSQLGMQDNGTLFTAIVAA
jgi:hypothetical protein